MSVTCSYSETGAPGVHEIADGDRRLDLTFRVDWAGVGGSHEKPLTFCSFDHLSRWAADKAAQHDPKETRDE